jgi:hypothetical protein
MRLTRKVLAISALAASVVVGCSPSSPTVAVSFEQFQFTCCANSEALTHAWHPGQVITLQWSAQGAGMTATDAPHQIALAAIFTGPYASVAALKARGPHSETLLSSALRVTDRTSSSALSTITLPIDLAAGWYDLVTSITSARGSTGGATVIQVTRLGS